MVDLSYKNSFQTKNATRPSRESIQGDSNGIQQASSRVLPTSWETSLPGWLFGLLGHGCVQRWFCEPRWPQVLQNPQVEFTSQQK